MRVNRLSWRSTPWALRWGNAFSWSSWGGTLRCTKFGAVMRAEVVLNQRQVRGVESSQLSVGSKGIIAEKTLIVTANINLIC